MTPAKKPAERPKLRRAHRQHSPTSLSKVLEHRSKVYSTLATGLILFQMRSRFERATAAMKAQGIEALVLTPGTDLFYLTGFEHGHAMERLLALVLRADGE